MKKIHSRLKIIRLKIIRDRICLGLLTFLMVIFGQKAIAHSPATSLPDTTRNPVSSVASVEMQKLSQKPGFFIERGQNFYEAGRLADALSVWQQAAAEFDREGDRVNEALSFNYISVAYQDLGELDLAREAIARSLNLLAQDEQVLPQVLNTQGSLQLAMGQTEAALETWKQAERAYTEIQDETGRLGSLINQAGALQALGQYHRARIILERVKAELDLQPDSSVKATGLHSLGMALQVVGDLEPSQQVLEQSLEMTRQLEISGDSIAGQTSAILFSLANTAKALGENDTALDYYEQAAMEASGAISQVEAQLNQLNLLIKMERWKSTRELLPQIESNLNNLSPSRMSVYARANFAQSLMNLEPTANPNQAVTNSESASESAFRVGQVLATAVREARELSDSRAESYALGQLGHLYEQTQQWSESRSLTEQALIIAQSINATDIIPRWQWQLGRVLKQQGNVNGAIAAYTEAINALQSLRGDLTAIASDIQFSFRESVEPIYRQLVGLLLQPTDGQVSQKNLKQARDTIELLQLAELDNFFRNACLTPEPTQIDRIDPTAATIYPIILPDRLGVILSLPGQPLDYYETPVTEQEVVSTIGEALQRLNPSFSSQKRLEFFQPLLTG